MTLATLTTIMGILMSLGYYPQAYKIWKNKSADDISIVMFLIFAIGNIVWLFYGIQIQSWVVILSFMVGVIGAWLTLTLALIYKKKL
jgi:MtN3 and saliva related transmembrane protein